jgi:cytochrome c peroxidase
MFSPPGESLSPLPLGSGADTGEIRLESDFNLARDARTACTWQSFVNEQEKMSNAFKAAMAKLAVIGHNREDLIDCSEAVPEPVPASRKAAT